VAGRTEVTPDDIAKALQKYICCYENARGEIEGIGYLRVEETDEETVLVFVSDERVLVEEVSIRE
jgi:hypothetical protein